MKTKHICINTNFCTSKWNQALNICKDSSFIWKCWNHTCYISQTLIKTGIKTFSKATGASLGWLKSLFALDELLNNLPAHTWELIAWVVKGKTTPKPNNYEQFFKVQKINKTKIF